VLCRGTDARSVLFCALLWQFPDCSPSKTAGCRGFSDGVCAIAQRRWPTVAEMNATPSSDDGTDEMTHMFADPAGYAAATYGETVTASWGGIAAPSHLVMFEPMAAAVADFLTAYGNTTDSLRLTTDDLALCSRRIAVQCCAAMCLSSHRRCCAVQVTLPASRSSPGMSSISRLHAIVSTATATATATLAKLAKSIGLQQPASWYLEADYARSRPYGQ
jgi:hypothetical protein